MPVRLSTTVNKISSLSNHNDASLLMELYQYMKENALSQSHMNNTLKTNMAFAKFLEMQSISFREVTRKDQITSFLDTKIKAPEEDPDKKWITTYRNRAEKSI
jgi:integrase/recombinase XerD